MNQLAERHLAKAEGYLAKGDGWYEKAADEIIAAKEADFSLSNREIGARFDRSGDWVSKLVRWRTSGASSPSPYSGEAPAINLRKTKQLLREAPLEQVEQIVTSLPKERQQAIAAAAGNRYAQARQEEDEKERSLTPAQRSEREAGRAATGQAVGRMMSSFSAMSIENHIEEATDKLKELISEHAVTEQSITVIDRALRGFLSEYQVARAMAGLDTDLDLEGVTT